MRLRTNKLVINAVSDSRAKVSTLIGKVVGYPAIHTLMLATAPVVILYSANVGEVHPSEIGILIAIAVGFAILLLILSCAILRNLRKAAVILTIFLILFLLYRPVLMGLERWAAWEAAWIPLLIVWVIFLVCGMYFAVKTRRSLNNLTSILNVMAIALVLVPSINIIINETKVVQKNEYIRSLRPMGLELSASRGTETLPDIYYIILDRYASASTLEEAFDFDNSEFINYLSAEGFYIASESWSNYINTASSLASSLNMEYLNYIAEGLGGNFSDVDPIYQKLQNNSVQHLLKAEGYECINIGNWWGPTMVNTFADKNFGYAGTPYFAEILFQNTMANSVLAKFGVVDDERSLHSNCILYAFDKLAEIPAMKESTFVFAHLLVTHPPYVFDRNGEYLTVQEASQRSEKVNYIDQLLFTNKRVMALIDEILSNSEVPPIIILQADEGPFPEGTDVRSFSWRSATEAQLRQKTGILNAYYMPGVDKRALYPSITPVNSFRVVFNLYFDANLELLPDRIYASSGNHPYDFFDVTDEVK